jgi:RHS repeat-associated protein
MLRHKLSTGLGSSSVLVNSSNGVVPGSTARYYPFGAYRTTPSQTITDRQFTGHQHNDDLGLIYMNARFYVPDIGRFASPDPIIPGENDPQLWNRFSYVRNAPLNYTDPSGHVLCPIGERLCRNPIGFSSINLGDTGSSVVNWARDTAVNLACGVVGSWCKVEDNVLQPATDIEFVQAGADSLIAFATPISAPAPRYLRAVPENQVGTSQPFKLRRGEDGLSVFEGVSPRDVLAELPGHNVPNRVMTIPGEALPPGTQVVPTPAAGLSQKLSDAHRIIIRPDGWSVDRFARLLRQVVE